MNMFQDSQRKSSICPSLYVLVQLANIFSKRRYFPLIKLHLFITIFQEHFQALRESGALMFGSVPLLCIDGLQLVQSQAIIRYLVRHFPVTLPPTPPTDVYCMASTHWPCPSLLLFLLARNHNKPPLSPSSFRHCYPHVYCIVLHCVDPALLFAAVFARLKSTSSLVTEVLRKK